MRRIGVRALAIAACIAVALAVAACGGSKGSSGGSGSSTASKGKIEAASEKLALEYTGGKEGKANSSLSPVTVGFVVQLGGTPSFPEMKAAANATTSFINDRLGGIDGHPLKLSECYMQAEEDGQKCGAQMLNEKVPIYEMGLAVTGNTSLYKTVNGKIPVLIGSTSAPADSTAPGGFDLGGGGSAVIYGMAVEAGKYKPKSVALVSVDNVGGKYTMEKIAEPAFKQLGIKYNKTVYYPETVTQPEMVAAVQAAGGSAAEVIFFDPSAPQECVSLYNALKQLGITKPVVTTPICNAESFIKATGTGPENWSIWGFGENPRVPSAATDLYRQVMEEYGQSQYINQGFAPQGMRDYLSIAKFANALGVSKLTPAGFTEQIKAFKGPAFMIPGELTCGKPYEAIQPTLCGTTAAGALFSKGKWTNLAPVSLPAKQ